MTDRSPQDHRDRHDEPGVDITIALDQWFGRLLRSLGAIVAIGLWLLAAGAMLLTLTR